MNKNFWKKLNKPVLALAPMAGITDSAFRQVCKEFGADVLYSEMASATALVYNPVKTLELLQSDKKEAPYVVQLFGSNPDHFAKAVKLITDKKAVAGLKVKNYQLPQGIDINFGCPVPKVFKQGAGAALMQNLKLAREVIKAVLENTDLPVSIKLRAKSGEVDCLRFLDYTRDLPISAVMIHGRTYAQGFEGDIDCGIIKKARDYFGGIILANGGIMNADDAMAVLEKTGADGIGIARGALGNPRIFANVKNALACFGKIRRDESRNPEASGRRDCCGAEVLKNTGADGIRIARTALGNPWLFRKVKSKKLEVVKEKDIFKTAIKHAKLAYKLKGKQGIIEMRKHLCWYVHGLSGASAIRRELVKVEDLEDVKRILQRYK